jgi:hypothetical protein
MLMWVTNPMLLEPWHMIPAYAYIYFGAMKCAVCLTYCSFVRRISMYMSLYEKEHMHISIAWLHVFMLDIMFA